MVTSTTKYLMEIRGRPPSTGFNDLRHHVYSHSWGVVIHTHDSRTGFDRLVVSYPSEKERYASMARLNQARFKGAKMTYSIRPWMGRSEKGYGNTNTPPKSGSSMPSPLVRGQPPTSLEAVSMSLAISMLPGKFQQSQLESFIRTHAGGSIQNYELGKSKSGRQKVNCVVFTTNPVKEVLRELRHSIFQGVHLNVELLKWTAGNGGSHVNGAAISETVHHVIKTNSSTKPGRHPGNPENDGFLAPPAIVIEGSKDLEIADVGESQAASQNYHTSADSEGQRGRRAPVGRATSSTPKQIDRMQTVATKFLRYIISHPSRLHRADSEQSLNELFQDYVLDSLTSEAPTLEYTLQQQDEASLAFDSSDPIVSSNVESGAEITDGTVRDVGVDQHVNFGVIPPFDTLLLQRSDQQSLSESLSHDGEMEEIKMSLSRFEIVASRLLKAVEEDWSVLSSSRRA